MTSPRILRMNEVCALIGWSKSTIDAKNRMGGKYYDPDFPQRMRLSKNGRAVGWYETDIVAYISKLGESKGEKSSPSEPAISMKKGRVGRPRKTASSSGTANPLPKAKRQPVAGTLGAAVVYGSDVVSHIEEYLRLPEWTLAMGCLLAQGIAPPPGIEDLATLTSVTGLDDKPVWLNGFQISAARQLREDIDEWREYGIETPATFAPLEFLVWCFHNDIETPWIKLINRINGSGEINPHDPIEDARLAFMFRR